MWQHQTQLQQLAVRSSALIGGFLTIPHVMQSLPLRLPVLKSLSLQLCPDLSPLQLAALVSVAPAPLIKVEGCARVTERDCVMLAVCSAGRVQVEYDSQCKLPE